MNAHRITSNKKVNTTTTCTAVNVITVFRGYRVVSSSLSDDDVTVVVCSVLFFAAFFIAVFTQYRAEASVCRLLSTEVTHLLINTPKFTCRDDPEMLAHRQARCAEDPVIKLSRPEGSTKTESCISIGSRQLPITVMETR
ncbi:hypothetical protein ANCDUO_14003 [Ancylostoma duodenale]|uniref:Uncharacterized protein n=1 Tax=Ancylostoma duodenale TaxID=51022 RepID=A0A0C2GFB6_9BILA|nr:hypothetical protein ANCDUO_14003 [Ancylostoma duodenale]